MNSDSIEILLTNENGKAWERYPAGYVKGFALCGDRLLTSAALLETVAAAAVGGTLDRTLGELNGNFSMVVRAGGKLVLIADKLRSYPLLFCKTNIGGGNCNGLIRIADRASRCSEGDR